MDSGARKQLRRYLLWGFGLSLLAHLILGPFLGRIHYSEAEKSEPTIVSVTKKTIRIATPKPTATPTPPPKPTPKPPPPPRARPPTPPPPLHPVPKQTQPPHHAAPAPPRLKLNVPKTTNAVPNQPAENPYVAKPGSANGVPGGHGAAGVGTGQSAGTPGTPAAGCAQPHVDPATKNPVQPEYPEVAREQGAFGTVKVAVTLDEHGTVVSAAIAQSAGNAALDQEAIKAAKASTYSPEIVDCKPVGGVYLFRAVFDSQ